ncbi:hypothetical protein L1987_00575 [Smallanthus sonchifolius]|uniref:Uncharacterized protein n=1 Tax=Smallanthus sonchifolius TaxID=185202 RepID=A0ACB9K2P5_9ASTR|nr:hypothetical protein L1987_00575 [Smallanthus sonchifolius]
MGLYSLKEPTFLDLGISAMKEEQQAPLITPSSKKAPTSSWKSPFSRSQKCLINVKLNPSRPGALSPPQSQTASRISSYEKGLAIEVSSAWESFFFYSRTNQLRSNRHGFTKTSLKETSSAFHNVLRARGPNPIYKDPVNPVCGHPMIIQAVKKRCVLVPADSPFNPAFLFSNSNNFLLAAILSSLSVGVSPISSAIESKAFNLTLRELAASSSSAPRSKFHFFSESLTFCSFAASLASGFAKGVGILNAPSTVSCNPILPIQELKNLKGFGSKLGLEHLSVIGQWSESSLRHAVREASDHLVDH